MQAVNNLKQIALAMHNYVVAHDGRFPPAVLFDKHGKPLHSWRVLILPYLEQTDLYKQFHLDERWDSPHNIRLLPRMPKVYGLPDGLPVEVRADACSTYYQVFVGKGTAFEGSQGLRLADDFPDGTANTVMVIEAGAAVPWTRPVDLVYMADQPLPPLGGIFTGQGRFSLFGPNREKGLNIAFVDGSVRFIKADIGEMALRDAITRNDGKTVAPD